MVIEEAVESVFNIAAAGAVIEKVKFGVGVIFLESGLELRKVGGEGVGHRVAQNGDGDDFAVTADVLRGRGRGKGSAKDLSGNRGRSGSGLGGENRGERRNDGESRN